MTIFAAIISLALAIWILCGVVQVLIGLARIVIAMAIMSVLCVCYVLATALEWTILLAAAVFQFAKKILR